MADGFDDDVGALAAGQLAALLDAFLAALGDDVGGAELRGRGRCGSCACP
nr:hypothetical protein [Cryptosporangium aurantiacum]